LETRQSVFLNLPSKNMAGLSHRTPTLPMALQLPPALPWALLGLLEPQVLLSA
jgi:hypothetical protein